MSKLSEFGVPGINSGMLHPAMAHQFRVILNDSKLLTHQTTKVTFNMAEQILTVEIEQPIGLSQELLDEIYKLCNSRARDVPFRFPFKVQLLDGGDEAHSEIAGFAHVLKHEYVLDYSVHQPARHLLVLRYTRGSQ